MVELWDVLDENGNKTGRLHERGKPMEKGEYHLVVHVWIRNKKGEFLISKRSDNHIWHTTGGCAIAGDDSLAAALREVNEEIGITLDPKNGKLFKRFNMPHVRGEGMFFIDAWLFLMEVDINDVALQLEEVCDVMWATEAQIKQMIDDGGFIGSSQWYPYLEELFCLCRGCSHGHLS